MTLRIANGAGFLGDQLDAPRRLVEAAEVDYLTLEYLAELTLSILARVREKNPDAGFAADFLAVLGSLCPSLQEQTSLKVVTNAGGMNPRTCAIESAKILVAAGLRDERIGVVTGDDILPELAALQSSGVEFANLDDNRPLEKLTESVVCANAYLGAVPIVEALADQARMVITGRVADASLTVGPAMHEFGWAWDEWNKLAAASVAGHLIECGAQVTGGYSTDWESKRLVDVGYPIAELSSDGSCLLTKPPHSGGSVTRQTVVEQLVYEIGDPRRYLTPDVVADFTSVEVHEAGSDRVAVSGATGTASPDSYKVSLAYRAGYQASGQLLVCGKDCVAKAMYCSDIVLDRVRQAGFALQATNEELLGNVRPQPDHEEKSQEPSEVILRISARDANREAVERFTREFAPLITSGPAGLAGYASGRIPVRPVFAFWPTTIPKDFVKARVEVRRASDWLSD